MTNNTNRRYRGHTNICPELLVQTRIIILGLLGFPPPNPKSRYITCHMCITCRKSYILYSKFGKFIRESVSSGVLLFKSSYCFYPSCNCQYTWLWPMTLTCVKRQTQIMSTPSFIQFQDKCTIMQVISNMKGLRTDPVSIFVLLY